MEPALVPIPTVHLFPELDRLLIDLLKSLSPDDWNKPTIARLWSVKDIAAHLLDGNLRTLSFSRDNYFGETPPLIDSYQSFIEYLNQLNHDWTKATRRLSPTVLVDLLESTGREFCDHLAQLKPFEPAIFSVAWAGQQQSMNWFHIAREYTEKFIHQQQIRDAVDKPALLIKELYYPFIDTFMCALPHTYRHTPAIKGTVIKLSVEGDIGGDWYLLRTGEQWQLSKDHQDKITAAIMIDPDTAWRLFSKGITPVAALKNVKLCGDIQLAQTALTMISVMV